MKQGTVVWRLLGFGEELAGGHGGAPVFVCDGDVSCRPLDGSDYPSWTNNVFGNPLDISQYVTWIPTARVATRLVPLYCRLKKGNGRGISHISKVPSVVLDGILKKNPAPVGAMNCGARQFFVKQSIPRSRPLGVAWRYGIVWPASRRACRIGPQVRCTTVSWDGGGNLDQDGEFG